MSDCSQCPGCLLEKEVEETENLAFQNPYTLYIVTRIVIGSSGQGIKQVVIHKSRNGVTTIHHPGIGCEYDLVLDEIAQRNGVDDDHCMFQIITGSYVMKGVRQFPRAETEELNNICRMQAGEILEKMLRE